MAKVAFTKLGLKKKEEMAQIHYNDITIDVKQYLPISEKIDIITNIINNSMEDNNNFINPIKIDVLLALEIIFAYTNLSFTDKQKEDGLKLYDLLSENGLIDLIYSAIPEEEIEFLQECVWDSVDAIYTYRNSAMGILENIRNNYDELDLNTSKIQEALSNPESLGLLKDVLSKLG